ncbi:MAG: EbhA [Lactobacillus sp.]|jgi:hypothetical protein|nr:EbhA [Lactobacillus sp.]MCI2033582.1 EbhA [Lactobacillus sp.]
MKKTIWVLAGAIIIALGGGGYYFGAYKPHQDAITSFQKAYSPLKKDNAALNKKITQAEKLTNSQAKPLTSAVKTTLTTAITDAKASRRDVPKLPKKTDAIKRQTAKAPKHFNYDQNITTLNAAITSYRASIQQRKLVTHPTQSFVVSRLVKVPTITGNQAATDANDPNASLNKAGSYTAAIFFASSMVTEDVPGTDILDKGTDAGGCIEVYKTSADANARDRYLKSFDGAGALNSGSHDVIGTVIIRTSANLTASQQQTLTTNIRTALTKL